MTRNVLITGGTSGVGKAIAKSFVEAGDNVIIVGRNKAKAISACNEIGENSESGQVDYVLGDLSDSRENEAVAQAVERRFSQLDILVHSAGVMPKTKSENIKINLRSHYLLTINLEQLLKKSKDARIYLITGAPTAVRLGMITENQSTELLRGLWLLTHKTLLVSLLADEFKSSGITVNAVFPGEVKSDLMEWTRNASNTRVFVVKKLTDRPKNINDTAKFFDNLGNEIVLNHHKYSVERAKRVLQPYLEIKKTSSTLH